METSFYTITSKKVKFDKKIIMLSDLHNVEYTEIIDIVRKQSPDIITVVGDIVDRHKKTFSRALGFLKELANISPTYFCFGNHELKFNVLSKDDILKTGTKLLDNEYIKHNDIYIGGQTPIEDFKWLKNFEKEEGFKLLLCHHPEYYKKHLKHRDVDLIFSGHAHGGQWRFFGHAIYAPNQGFFPKYTSGLYDGKLLVSRGLSDARIVPRIGNPTHVLVINLKKEV